MDKNKKIFLVIAAFIVLAVVIMVIFTLFNKDTTKELVCKSNNGNITLYYDNNRISGYTANGYTYDLLSESEHAMEIGIEKYMQEFSTIFINNTAGTCVEE